MTGSGEHVLGAGISGGIDWELVHPQRPAGGLLVSIRSSVGRGPGIGTGDSRHLAGLVIGHLGSRDQSIVALFGAVSADFHHVRVELVDGSRLVADIVDARDELDVNLCRHSANSAGTARLHRLSRKRQVHGDRVGTEVRLSALTASADAASQTSVSSNRAEQERSLSCRPGEASSIKQ